MPLRIEGCGAARNSLLMVALTPDRILGAALGLRGAALVGGERQLP